jgi:hypothetical protein
MQRSEPHMRSWEFEFLAPQDSEDSPATMGIYSSEDMGDQLILFVQLLGNESSPSEASVTILFPKELLVTPNTGTRQSDKVLLILQQLLIAGMPYWDEGPDWLAPGMSQFGPVTQDRQLVRTTVGSVQVQLDTELGTFGNVEVVSVALTASVIL